MEGANSTDPIPSPQGSPTSDYHDSNSSSPNHLSCCVCFKLKLPWKRIRKTRSRTIHPHHHHHHYSIKRKFMAVGSCSSPISDVTAALCTMKKTTSKQKTTTPVFNYDPLSYAQNFDDGCCGMGGCDQDEYYSRGFTSRFAAPAAAAKSSSATAVV